MPAENRFTSSEPLEDAPNRWSSREDYDLTGWNDAPPHENGEGWDGAGFGGPAQPTHFVAP
ncbi:MAG TPA: hypothetical protein H9883_02370 [Candidatus Ruthenibacterium merdigallinarum]|nr:hypothetical protein [Candidatus Ruthenibacterium merdigallinarum]